MAKEVLRRKMDLGIADSNPESEERCSARKNRGESPGEDCQDERARWIGFIPYGEQTLTPERAAEWLRNSSSAYHGLAAQAAKVAEDTERIAVGNLMYWVSNMVDACAEAIASGVAIEIESDLNKSGAGASEETVFNVSKVLCAVARAAAMLSEEDPRGDFCDFGGFAAAQELATALAISSGHPLAEEAA